MTTLLVTAIMCIAVYSLKMRKPSFQKVPVKYKVKPDTY